MKTILVRSKGLIRFLISFAMILGLSSCKDTPNSPENTGIGNIGDTTSLRSPATRYLIQRTERDSTKLIRILRTAYLLDSTSPLGADGSSTYVLFNSATSDTLTTYFGKGDTLYVRFDEATFPFHNNPNRDTNVTSEKYWRVNKDGDTVRGYLQTTFDLDLDTLTIDRKSIPCYHLRVVVSAIVKRQFNESWFENIEFWLAKREGIILRTRYKLVEPQFSGDKLLKQIDEDVMQILD